MRILILLALICWSCGFEKGFCYPEMYSLSLESEVEFEKLGYDSLSIIAGADTMKFYVNDSLRSIDYKNDRLKTFDSLFLSFGVFKDGRWNYSKELVVKPKPDYMLFILVHLSKNSDEIWRNDNEEKVFADSLSGYFPKELYTYVSISYSPTCTP